MNIKFKLEGEDFIREVSQQEILEFPKLYSLDTLIPGRYSSLFIANLIILQKTQNLEPAHVIDEIKHLEGLRPSNQTKPSTQFTGKYLKGLWHKHFFPALPSVIGHNIVNHFGKNGIEKLVKEVLDPKKSQITTKEMLNELAHRVVVESLENRGAQEKLTGEWIIYAIEGGENYYICICPHKSGDEKIANNIKASCLTELPFLNNYFS